MPARAASNTWHSATVAASLSWTAGFVDAVCFVALTHVFVANMTGNTIAVGIGIAQNRWDLVFRRGLAIPVFVAGMLSSRLWVRVGDRWRLRSVAATAYACEALLLALFARVAGGYVVDGAVATDSQGWFLLFVALPSFAMGIQNATLSHFGPLSVRTTHITGTLAEFTDEAAKCLLLAAGRKPASAIAAAPQAGGEPAAHQQTRDEDEAAADDRSAKLRRSARRAVLFFTAWLVYAFGALLGVWLKGKWELAALYIPVAVLVAVVIADLLRPLRAAPM